MAYPVKNNEAPQNDPNDYGDYGNGDDYNDFDSGDGMEFDDGSQDPNSSDYVNGDGSAQESQTISNAQDARHALKDLEDLLKISDLPKDQIEEIKQDIAKLKGQINVAAGFSSPSSKEKAFAAINDKMLDLENRINGVGQEDQSGGDGSVQSQIDKIEKQAKDLLDKGAITQSTYDSILQDTTKAKSINDTLGADGEAQVEELITSAQDKLVNGGSTSAKGQNLVDELKKQGINVTLEEVAQAATDNGVDLDNPQPGEALMKMLSSLGVPSSDKIDAFNQDKTTRFSNMATIKTDLDGQLQGYRDDSENPPQPGPFMKEFAYYQRTDPEYQKLAGAVTEWQGNIVGALKALGLDAAAGATPDQVTVAGTPYDFFDEDHGTIMFSTTCSNFTITQDDSLFSAAPNNTSEDDAHNGWGEASGATHEDPAGYPEINFGSGGDVGD